MGCCGGNKNLKYEYDGKTKTIPMKQATTIDRFSQGANARRKTKQMIEQAAKEIAGKFKHWSSPQFRSAVSNHERQEADDRC